MTRMVDYFQRPRMDPDRRLPRGAGVITVTWNHDERTVEFYRDRHHVAVFGLFEDGAIVTWAIFWGSKSKAGRFPRRRTQA
jgi:hypothetical protein